MTIAALPIAIPLLVAAGLAATDMVSRRWMADVAAVATAATTTTLCAILLVRSFHGPIVYWMGGWRPAHSVALGISLTIDSLGAGLAVLTGTLVTAALIFSGVFFHNFIALGTPGKLLSAGTIPLSNIGVGIEVSGAFILLWTEFLDQALVVRGT